MAKREENNNDNTDKKNIQYAMLSLPDIQLAPEQQNLPASASCPT